MSKLSDFSKGIIVGVLFSAVIFSIFSVFYFKQTRACGTEELFDYVEKQIEIETLREELINRSPDEFLEVPDVRRAADGAAAEFERKRDEALQRFRSRVVN